MIFTPLVEEEELPAGTDGVTVTESLVPAATVKSNQQRSSIDAATSYHATQERFPHPTPAGRVLGGSPVAETRDLTVAFRWDEDGGDRSNSSLFPEVHAPTNAVTIGDTRRENHVSPQSPQLAVIPSINESVTI